MKHKGILILVSSIILFVLYIFVLAEIEVIGVMIGFFSVIGIIAGAVIHSGEKKENIKAKFNTPEEEKAYHLARTKRKFTISVILAIIGLLLIVFDQSITRLAIGTCYKCWGKGVVENALGIMVDCKNCTGGQLAYTQSSFGVSGALGALILLPSAFVAYFNWKVLH